MTGQGRQHREAVRLEAAGLIAEGVAPLEAARRTRPGRGGPADAARQTRVSSKSARQWHKAWREGGTAALASRGPSVPSRSAGAC